MDTDQILRSIWEANADLHTLFDQAKFEGIIEFLQDCDEFLAQRHERWSKVQGFSLIIQELALLRAEVWLMIYVLRPKNRPFTEDIQALDRLLEIWQREIASAL